MEAGGVGGGEYSGWRRVGWMEVSMVGGWRLARCRDRGGVGR